MISEERSWNRRTLPSSAFFKLRVKHVGFMTLALCFCVFLVFAIILWAVGWKGHTGLPCVSWTGCTKPQFKKTQLKIAF